ncbi:hypothetical protein [Chryseobacterium pennae]|uniref:hypothetical protein n=1 Tax=Chryseobacterium pennae TaxID=2258962 RepID=UPI0014020FEB|nr:hypothetical protein [Chryseobacterium pennae]
MCLQNVTTTSNCSNTSFVQEGSCSSCLLDSVSIIENSESVEDSKLESIAKILEIPVETIKEYFDDKVMNIINSTITDSTIRNNFCTFNPLDKLIEAHEENKKLYERLFRSSERKNSIFRENR